MKISLFSHNAVIGVDAPLCHKSKLYVDDLIERGEAFMLPPGEFRRPAVRLRPFKGADAHLSREKMVGSSREVAAESTISFAQMQANAGIVKPMSERAERKAIQRARDKVKAWMMPSTSDQRAPLPRGKWINLSAIEVTASL